jgi:hypothetical protein
MAIRACALLLFVALSAEAREKDLFVWAAISHAANPISWP